MSASVNEFLTHLENDLKHYVKHDFIAHKQASYISTVKENLKEGEFLVSLDFAENYSFVVQDAIQSFHWNNAQATVHPYVIYYNNGDEIEHYNFVIISESLKHDTVAVSLFNKKMIHFLKQKHGCEQVRKIFFFSDGAASQYKNKKNFCNLACFKNDFNIEVEWHFFATSHGKGACDGIGGTVKRNAARVSLQRVNNELIVTPKALYEWCKKFFVNISFAFGTTSEYDAEMKLLNKRFEKSRTIKNTRNFHSFIPVNDKKLLCRVFSASELFLKTDIFN